MPLLAAIFNLDPAGEAAALNGPLSGSSLPQTNFVAPNTARVSAGLIQDRLAPGSGAFGVGVSTASLANGGAGLEVAGLDVLSDGDEQVAQASTTPGNPWAFWSRGYGNFALGDSSTAAPGFSANTGGVIFGADYKIDGNILLGAAFNYSHTGIAFDDQAGSSTVESYTISPYGRYSQGDWYASAVASFGIDSFDTSRPVGFPGFSGGNATASPDGQVYGFAAETGYALHSDLMSNPLTVTPLAGFGYTHLHADSFTESGGSVADLAVSGSDVDSFTTSFGARASTRIDAGANGVLVPEAHAIWQREFLDDRAKVGASFAVAPGSGFTVVSNRFGANTGLVGIGVTQEASADVKLFVNYDAQIQSSFASHTISAGLRVRF